MKGNVSVHDFYQLAQCIHVYPYDSVPIGIDIHFLICLTFKNTTVNMYCNVAKQYIVYTK